MLMLKVAGYLQGDAVKVNMHKANSACCYVVCTFGSSSNKLYECICENCVLELLNTLKIIAGNCISEMNNCTAIEISKTSQMV